MRKFFLILVLFLGVTLVILSFGEIQTILQTLQRANFWFVVLALIIQGAWFFAVGRMYRSVFHLLGMEDTTRSLTLVAAAVIFVNTVTPMAGIGGIALFAAEARRRGQPAGKATVAGPLFLLFDEASFLIVLALGMFILFRRNNLGAGEITAAIILLAIACAIALFLYLGYRSAGRLGSLLARMAAFANRMARPILHHDYLSEERAHLFAEEIGEGLSGLTQKPANLLEPVSYGLLGKVLLMGVLICSFLAFDVPFTAGTIIGGFSIAYLFLIVSPTPSGIGVVEGVMALALASLRVVWSEAVIITLVYRAMTFWVPLGVGAIAFRKLH